MSRQSEHLAGQAGLPATAEFSRDERRILLQIAHHAILSELSGQTWQEEPVPAKLRDPRGVFTTLYLQGELRGCVGYAMPVAPLHRAVDETARAAAFEDSRFLPVSRAEAPLLEISLSVLSLLFPILPELVEVGRHGLVVSLGFSRGLLLPQVPSEYGWDRKTFLEQTCHKAGLPADAWRRGAKLEAFSAEVFGDADVDSK